MKYLAYAFLALATTCNAPKKGKETHLKDSLETEVTTQKNVETPNTKNSKLIVILNNAENLNDVKQLVKNSGLTWSKMAYETDAAKIGIIEVPANKSEFWVQKLLESDEFRLVDVHSEKKLASIISEEKNALIKIKKTACFGDCPIYTVAIDKDGNVVYNGKEYVLVKGIQKFSLTNKQLQNLNDKLNQKSFSSFNSVYDNPRISDLGSTYIVHNGKQVKIRLWKDIPDELIDIHEYITDILLDKKFIE